MLHVLGYYTRIYLEGLNKITMSVSISDLVTDNKTLYMQCLAYLSVSVPVTLK
jgi:alpha-acetolactate decarboxylase